MSERSPMALWHQADRENPGNASARGERYRELMIEHGLLIPREPGDDSPLFPCGYDPRRRAEDL